MTKDIQMNGNVDINYNVIQIVNNPNNNNESKGR
jgi:hypothetical protein